MLGLSICTGVISAFVATVLKDPGIVRGIRDHVEEMEKQPIATKDALSDWDSSSSDTSDEIDLESFDIAGTIAIHDSDEDSDDSTRGDVNDVDSSAGRDSTEAKFEPVGFHSMRKPSKDLETSSSAVGGNVDSTAPESGPSVTPGSIAHLRSNPTQPHSASLNDSSKPMTLGDRFLQDLEMEREQSRPPARPRPQGEIGSHMAAQQHPIEMANRAGGPTHGRTGAGNRAITPDQLAQIRRKRARRPPLSSYCDICCLTPPPGSAHCEDCEVCIAGYDHHCPWTSKCIGEDNVCEFYTWVITGLLAIAYMGVMTGLSFHPDLNDPSARHH
eukprot:GHVN01096360.1.p1 GENE.GHVN01096360.1~~GHVN01096360.1.p1  ORF type:complete len:329 (+),score=41.27 GHVN01096360.1:268-1254(+)